MMRYRFVVAGMVAVLVGFLTCLIVKKRHCA